jgi:hypothetical protein
MTYDWYVCVVVGAGAEVGAVSILKHIRLQQTASSVEDELIM